MTSFLTESLSIKWPTDLVKFPVVDFSHQHITLTEDIDINTPRVMHPQDFPVSGESGKYLSLVLWLNNNEINDTSIVVEMATIILERPTLLMWIDLSNNQISEIDDVLQEFTNLNILYLHSNNISDINGIDKLANIPSLRTLTLHDNPIDSIPNYRTTILNLLPQIASLDLQVHEY
uniref:Leucine-rich repeat-containing protein 51 n=1 Tax=Clastoptera arizonana TaxID=38151 RepID=A0A1B6C8X5_9HEMI